MLNEISKPWRPNRLQRFSIGIIFFLIACRLAYPSEQAKIKYQLDLLGQTASISELETGLLTERRASKLKNYFTSKPEVDLEIRYRDVPKINKREELVDKYSKVRQNLHYLKIGFRDTKLVNVTDKEAFVRSQIKAQLSSDKDHFQEVPVEISFKKVQGLWKIASLKNLEPLEL